jgi:hypothetical protein
MGMRISYNARHGGDAYAPQSDVLKNLFNQRRDYDFKKVFFKHCQRLEVPHDLFLEWDDDALRGLNVEILESMGVSKPNSEQLTKSIAFQLRWETELDAQCRDFARRNTETLTSMMLRREAELLEASNPDDSFAADKVRQRVCEEFGFTGEHTEEGFCLLRGQMPPLAPYTSSM